MPFGYVTKAKRTYPGAQILTATDATTAHTAACLLHGQLGLCYGYAALDHILTTPVDSSGVITQYYVLSLPLNILKKQ